MDTLAGDIIKAIRCGSESDLLECLQKSKDLTTQLPDLMTEAIQQEDINIMKILLDHGLEVNQVHGDLTSLMFSAFSSSDDMMRYLISRGAKFHNRKMKCSFLIRATYFESKIIKDLFDRFFLVDLQYRDNKTEINKCRITKNFKDTLENNSKLFQSVCKLSLSCMKCIITKLFPN